MRGSRRAAGSATPTPASPGARARPRSVCTRWCAPALGEGVRAGLRGSRVRGAERGREWSFGWCAGGRLESVVSRHFRDGVRAGPRARLRLPQVCGRASAVQARWHSSGSASLGLQRPIRRWAPLGGRWAPPWAVGAHPGLRLQFPSHIRRWAPWDVGDAARYRGKPPDVARDASPHRPYWKCRIAHIVGSVGEVCDGGDVM